MGRGQVLAKLLRVSVDFGNWDWDWDRWFGLCLVMGFIMWWWNETDCWL